MRIVSTPVSGVNVPLPSIRQEQSDPGGLSRASALDIDRNGALDSNDVQQWRAAAATGGLSAVWQASQAAMLVALGRTNANDSVRGALPAAPSSGTNGPADAIAAVASLDLTPLRAAGVPLIAAFDYDDTLSRGDVFIPAMKVLAHAGLFADTAKPTLIKALVQAGMSETEARSLTPNQAAIAAAERTGAAIPIADAFYLFGDAMRGMSADQARTTMRTAFEQGMPEHGIAPLRSSLFDSSAQPGDGATDLVAATRANGLTPWLVTWGFDFIAQAAAPWVGVDPRNVVGHSMHERDGRFDGLVVSAARPKWEMMRDAFGAPPIVAFGNSSSDLPMLDAAVGPTFIVNPVSEKMRAAVTERAGRTAPIWFNTPGTQNRE